jgi:dTDP-4-dehydrorhamnose reductase
MDLSRGSVYMSRVLITGGAGLLGSALIRRAPAGVEIHCTQRRTPAHGCAAHTVDLADAAATEALVRRLRPGLVIHTAYSFHGGERDILAATRNVVDAATGVDAALVHLSTDALLDGEHAPYDEGALPAPVHEYGRFKAQTEDYVRQRAPGAAIVRTSLLVSLDPPDPRTAWVLAGLRGERRVSLFTDELRCPTEVGDLAGQLWELAELPAAERAGVWHLAGPEAMSRYALGVLLAGVLGMPAGGLTPAASSESPEPRPRDLRLLTGRADRALRSRARPISHALAAARLAGAPGQGYNVAPETS